MIKVNVVSDENSWSKRIKKKEKLFSKVCKIFPKKFKFHNKSVFFTLLLSNNKKIKYLNKKFRKKNKHTDVLSFPFESIRSKSKEIYLGDIIISFNHIDRYNELDNKEFEKKTIRIFIHGFLHLLGYDHLNFKDFEKMSKQEIKLINIVEKLLY